MVSASVSYSEFRPLILSSAAQRSVTRTSAQERRGGLASAKRKQYTPSLSLFPHESLSWGALHNSKVREICVRVPGMDLSDLVNNPRELRCLPADPARQWAAARVVSLTFSCSRFRYDSLVCELQRPTNFIAFFGR